VDDPNHVIVINEWSHGFAIQRLLEPNAGTATVSLLINGRSQPKVENSFLFWGSASCCAHFIKVIRRSDPRNNFQGVYFIFYILYIFFIYSFAAKNI
jgi:hypothetical protein